MKALTVRQPWASLIIHGPKRVENRNWPTRYRGPLLIHAGSNRTGRDRAANVLALPLDYGVIIGAVVLSDCVPVDRCFSSPFTEGPWCWLVGEPIAFSTPIPWRGSLGLFTVPDEQAWAWIRAAGSGVSRHLQLG